MRFWITKNSELPVREQLARQVLLGILSEDLPAGKKLPSVRALARRHNIHANTVSAAYHDLLEKGWLELRRGSGLYVRPLQVTSDIADPLGRVLADMLKAARILGYDPEQVLQRLQQLVRPIRYETVVVAEDDPAMRRILQAEIEEHLKMACAEQVTKPGNCLIVALSSRLAKVREGLPAGVFCLPLRLRSVGGSLVGQSRPEPNSLISIVSASPEIRFWARAMLLAVGLEPDGLQEVDANLDGWRERLGSTTLAITDMMTARELPAGCIARVFRIIADSSLEELKQLCIVTPA